MLFKLLTLPVSAPVSGFRFILERLLEMAERELYDEERIRDEYLLLQLQLEEGEITEPDYLAREAEIMARWRAARALSMPAAVQGSPEVTVGEVSFSIEPDALR